MRDLSVTSSKRTREFGSGDVHEYVLIGTVAHGCYKGQFVLIESW